MKVGDLGRTHLGNLAIVVEIGGPGQDPIGGAYKVEWYNIVFCDTGNLRTGYPVDWLSKVEAP
ncbi:MAG: hypothetical protein CMB80_03275 [Flammeovirgaceae bacterium]|nr:hypothetical protein [Flammeovirgaceae bacterium]